MRVLIATVLCACSSSTTPAKPIVIPPCSLEDASTFETALRLCSAFYFERSGCEPMVVVKRYGPRSGTMRRTQRLPNGRTRVSTQVFHVRSEGQLEGTSYVESFDAKGERIPDDDEPEPNSCVPSYDVTAIEPGVFDLRGVGPMSGDDVWHVDEARCKAALAGRTTPLMGGCN